MRVNICVSRGLLVEGDILFSEGRSQKIFFERKKHQKSDFSFMIGVKSMELTNEKLIETLVLISLMAEMLAERLMFIEEAKSHGNTV